jgi:hypothetical protein
MLYRLKQWWRVRQAEKGKATWGRLELPLKPTLHITVTREDGTVEEYGPFDAEMMDETKWQQS